MKKLLSFAFLTLGLFVSTSANAQGVKFGVKGGLNITDMNLDSKLLCESNCVGGFIGPTIKFTLPNIGLASMLQLSTTIVKQRLPTAQIRKNL